jgi:menaquinone-dependent protoporphyrinogen IX oxidase
MKVCVLYAPATKEKGKIKEIAKALSEGIASQGHIVDVLDMTLETGKIVSYYDYLVIGTETNTFLGGKIPASVSSFLKSAGSISGKRCLAFITKGGVRSMKTLQTLMRTMESEGMYLKKSELISKTDYARAVGKHLKISI